MSLCFAEIDIAALHHNLKQISQRAPHSQKMIMVKGGGYGHGILRIAKALPDNTTLGVARICEAIQLREAGIANPILLMEGFTTAEDLPLIDKFNLDFIIHDISQLHILQQQSLSTAPHCWLKIDTGMHRLGINPTDFKTIYQGINQCLSISKPIGLMTHFAKADEVSDKFTQLQAACFEKTIHGINAPKSLANSAAILAWPQTHADWVRPGIMIYGVSPFPFDTGVAWDLKPVMTLKAKIIAIKHLNKGEPVGYGCTWRSSNDYTKIGVVAIGYGDGYPRYIQNGAPLLINGQRAPIIGRVSMDMITVDLSTHPEHTDTKLGDVATLWGKGLPVEEIAHYANTSPYELLCGVTSRVEFVMI